MESGWLVTNLSSGSSLLVLNGKTALDVLSLSGVTEVTSGKHVELIFLLIHGAVDEEENNTSNEGNDGNGAVVPDETGIGGQRSEGLCKRSRESSGKQLDGLDEGAHVLWRLGESVLKGGDGSEDLRDGDENVDTSDGPDVDGRLVISVGWVLVETRGLVATN